MEQPRQSDDCHAATGCRSPEKKCVLEGKWGRHCCRPHSHRPVVSSSGEPSDERLAPDVSPFLRQAGDPVLSPALAPASGSSRGRFGPKTSPRLKKPRPVIRCWPGISSGSAFAEAFAFPSMPDRNVRPAAECFRVPLERPTCVRPKPSACGPQRPRGQSPLHHPGLKSPSLSGRWTVNRRVFRSLPINRDCSGEASRSRSQRPSFPLFNQFAVDERG